MDSEKAHSEDKLKVLSPHTDASRGNKCLQSSVSFLHLMLQIISTESIETSVFSACFPDLKLYIFGKAVHLQA